MMAVGVLLCHGACHQKLVACRDYEDGLSFDVIFIPDKNLGAIGEGTSLNFFSVL